MDVQVACLHTIPGLVALAEKQEVRLSDDTNRTCVSMMLSKMGTAAGQKVVQKLVQKSDLGWGDEQFEVESILDFTVNEGTDYYLIKWKGWSNAYNSWEPKSNLDCEDLIEDFRSSFHGRKRPNSTVNINLEPENKKRRISELVDTMIHYNAKLTASDLLDAFEQLGTNQKTLQSFRMPNIPRRRILKAAGNISNKRTKAYKLHSEEVRRALKDWEKQLNKINTDPAPIFVENNVDLEGPPMNFHYINDYIAGEGVILDANPVVGCECKDCMKEKSTCCGRNAGSEFAYYVTRRVRLPPGYPIYECNRQCKCGNNCPNRVVQLGRKHRVCIFRTNNGRGWGVKTLQKIKKGSFVMEYVGEVITNEEAERRGQNYDANGMTYLFDLDYQDPDCPFTVDAGVYGNVSHFVNHSCDPNLTVYGVWINNLDPRMPRIALFASRDIQRDEELTFDYMMTGEMTDNAEPEVVVGASVDSVSVQPSDSETTIVDSPAVHETTIVDSPAVHATPSYTDLGCKLLTATDSSDPTPLDIDVIVTSPQNTEKAMSSCVIPPTVITTDLTATTVDDVRPTAVNDDSAGSSGTTMSHCDESVGYVSCSSSVLSSSDAPLCDDVVSEATTDTDGGATLQGFDTADSNTAPFFRRPKMTSLASKYRLMCQCGAKNCRKYLY